MHALRAPDSATAWRLAAQYLATRPGYECFDLSVEIEDATAQDATTRAEYQTLLEELDLPSVETVVNTIFPDCLWGAVADRVGLYDRYRRLLPRLERFGKNRRGTYFGRLVQWPSSEYNQIEGVIERIRSELSGRSRKRFVYDLLVFQPGRDAYPYGFPCLSYINVKLDTNADPRLLMTAHYRNHYFIERAYGNYLGLGHLQRFIADSAGIAYGPLVCVSGHAELDHDKVRASVVARIRAFAPAEVA